MHIIPGSVKLLNMSDEEYFGDGLPGHLSNSRMGLINPAEGGSPSRYSTGFDKKTDSLMLGSAVHQLVLEGEYYRLADVDVPSDAVRKIINTVHGLTTRNENPLSFNDAVNLAVQLHNYYKGKPSAKILETMVSKSASYYEFLCKNHDDPTLIYLAPDMKIKCVNAVKAVTDSVKAHSLLNPSKSLEYANEDVESFNEHVLVCKILYNGKVEKLKAKLDNFTINHTRKVVTLNDLKTSSYSVSNFFGNMGLELVNLALVPRLFKGSFQKYHYYRQMYMYLEMLKGYIASIYGEHHGYEFECNMIVTETFGYKPSADVFSVESEWLDLGKTEFNHLLELIQELSGESSELDKLEFEPDDFANVDNDPDSDLDDLFDLED